MHMLINILLEILQEFSLCIAFSSFLFCPTNSVCLSLPGLVAPLKESVCLHTSSPSLCHDLETISRQQNRLVLWLTLFPISQWSTSLVKTIVLYSLTHFCFSQMRVNLVPVTVIFRSVNYNCFFKTDLKMLFSNEKSERRVHEIMQ